MSKFSDLFEQGLIRLDSMSNVNFDEDDGGYPLVPLVSRNWKGSEKRLLIIVESVDRTDLKEGRLLATKVSDRGNLENPMTHLLPVLLDRSQLMASQFLDDPENHSDETDFALSVANFNAAPSFKLEGSDRKAINRKFASRCIQIIKRLKPTHVLVCGDSATLNILEHMEHPEAANCWVKRGWVMKCNLDGLKFKLTPTLDLESVYNPKASEDSDDDNDNADKYAIADLLYFVARNVTNLLAGKHLYNLSHIVANPRYIDTIEKFDAMMDDINKDEHKLLAIDSETAGLESYANKIYFLQVAYNTEFGYCLPIQHPKSPFTKEEQRYILGVLRAFFARRKKLKSLIFINGMFDMRIFRAQLKINVIHHHILEVTGAESLLDENMGLFARAKWRVDGAHVGTSYQNLRNLFCLYGNDLYYRMAFSKEERNTCGAVASDNPDLLKYCSLDVQSIFGILQMQVLRARHTYVKPTFDGDYVVYYPFFIKHLKNQMRNTAVGISMMEQSGSPVDMEYLDLLKSKNSPLLKELKRIEADLRHTDAVKETEKLLASKFGRSGGGLFGGGAAQFFDLSKKEHLEYLFFDVLKLDPVLFTSTGQRSIDKNFIKEYADDVHEVQLFGSYVKTSKLLSTYVKGWYKKIMGSVDSALRKTLNPGFGFFTVITGRLNSFNPSLQQVPSRGGTAKYIKRMFRAPKGSLNIKYDYSAQEVRQWSVLSGDRGVAASFRAGLELRKQWIVSPTAELKAELKKRGDVHVNSVHRFFNKWVDKSDPLRDAVKAIVFG